MKITADTNILVRAIMDDDELQSPLAQAELSNAEVVVLALTALCELVWVMSRSYGVSFAEIAGVLRRLMHSANVVVNRPAVEAGLILLEAGGDFADGVIAFEGLWLGAEAFSTFDKRAASLLEAKGVTVRLLS